MRLTRDIAFLFGSSYEKVSSGLRAAPVTFTRRPRNGKGRMCGQEEEHNAMSAAVSGSSRPARRLHPVAIRIMHWTNAVAMLVMITSGWGIYDDDVIIRGLHFSGAVRLGDWAAWSLNWHLAGMWLLMLNGLAYLIYGLVTGRLRERMLPIRIGDLVHTVRDTLRLKIAHDDLTTYNAVQKLLYIVVILAAISQVVTGLAIWKPVQFSGLVALLGGFQAARVIHFVGMAVIFGFLLVHVALSLLVPRTLWAMLAGGPRLGPSGRGAPERRP
jgi:thiosulfate reductase cytochrome b subunit